MKIQKSKYFFLLIAVSLAVLCIFSCGCTSRDGSSQTTAQNTGNPTTGSEKTPGMQAAGDGNMTAPQGERGGPGGMSGQMDLAAAAEELGVTGDELTAALALTEEGDRMDLTAAADELGVTVEELQDALGMGGMPDGTPPGEPPA